MEFGSWLSQMRQQVNVTQRDLARKCAVTPAYIAHLENGTSDPPPMDTCKALARAMGVDWREVWRRSFTARFARWLRREGYSRISTESISRITAEIEEANK